MPSYPNRYSSYSGGRGGGGGFTLSFPPFRGAVRTLVLTNVAVFFLVLLGNIASSGFQDWVYVHFGLVPVLTIFSGWIWQLITYGFLHMGIGHIFANMFMLWMFGSTIEGTWGRQRFLQFYFFCLVGAALTTIGVGYLGFLVTKSQFASSGAVTPFWFSLAQLLKVPTVGASGGVYGVLIAFGILYGDQEIFMFPLPFRIKAKYMVAALILLVLASALQPASGGVANFAHLGGLFCGWLYVKFGPRGALNLSVSERYFGLRNAYYRWKRRRAARKFEVYMRQHNRDEYFDEYGNYRDPKTGKSKGNGEHRGPWVQ
jgi:membrane associated rhomboid family serine protease